MTRHQRILRALLPCPDHTDDRDWGQNSRKQYCEAVGCIWGLCPKCAYKGKIISGDLYGFCAQHQGEKSWW